MALRLGVGVITYNRKDVLAHTLTRVQELTRTPHILVVADDGSEDGTVKLLRERNIATVTGRNMGIAWNKNRALYLLCEILNCDVIVLLEDDSFPEVAGWEAEWIAAAQRWGHANLAGDWFRDSFIDGAGTVDDPVLSKDITAQCSAFSREALLYGGYFDPRFRGYGQEHVEHTRRLLRLGYGGSYESIGGEVRPIYKLLRGSIRVTNPGSFANNSILDRNALLCHKLLFDEAYRAPWSDDTELLQFRAEMELALMHLRSARSLTSSTPAD